jgi:hypothetical protein
LGINETFSGRNNDQIFRFVGSGHHLENAINELKILRRMHISMIHIDHAITIQK